MLRAIIDYDGGDDDDGGDDVDGDDVDGDVDAVSQHTLVIRPLCRFRPFKTRHDP